MVGRHAGQRGTHWLDAALQAASSDRLAILLGRFVGIAPPLWQEERDHAPPTLSEESLSALRRVSEGCWPLPPAAAAGTARFAPGYMAMGVGRIVYLAAVADGALAPQLLPEKLFTVSMKHQAARAQGFCTGAGFDWDAYARLHNQLANNATL